MPVPGDPLEFCIEETESCKNDALFLVVLGVHRDSQDPGIVTILIESRAFLGVTPALILELCMFSHTAAAALRGDGTHLPSVVIKSYPK